MPRRNISVQKEVERALFPARRLKWSQLLDKTGVSAGALSPHLKWLMDKGRVETEVDTTTRPATTYYKLTKGSRLQQKLWPEAWNEEMEKTHEFLDIIVNLDLEEKRLLQKLVDKYIRLEEWTQKEREKTHTIIEESDGRLVLRNRKDKRIIAVLTPGFPENQKKDEKKSLRKEKSTLKQKDEPSFLELIYGSG
jgi:DNA-binding MarR family transcriptional regulator